MKTINYLLILLCTILLSWFIPMLCHLISDTATNNIFTYYSSVEKSFCTIAFDEKKECLLRTNVTTSRQYTEAEFDSILPMFYYRQLLADGKLPDSIYGTAITPRIIGQKTFYYRYNATHKHTPHIPLYTLFESFSGRVRLEMPGDVFRLNNKVEFIAPETNKVNQEKSEQFTKAFNRAKFQFPAKVVAGNPSTQKAYDEGYFVIDAKDEIFHLKMVNGMPFIKNIGWKQEAKPVFISTIEPEDRSFYAFVFDENHNIWIISTDGYKTEQIPSPPFNMDKDHLLIMANPFYWNVNVTANSNKQVYAIKADTKEVVDKYNEQTQMQSTQWAKYLLPFELTMESPTSDYVTADILFNGWMTLMFNAIFIFTLIIINRSRSKSTSILALLWVGITGLFGFIALWLFTEEAQETQKIIQLK